jgi:hypothetical protein
MSTGGLGGVVHIGRIGPFLIHIYTRTHLFKLWGGP